MKMLISLQIIISVAVCLFIYVMDKKSSKRHEEHLKALDQTNPEMIKLAMELGAALERKKFNNRKHD